MINDNDYVGLTTGFVFYRQPIIRTRKYRMKKVIWNIVFIILCIPTFIQIKIWELENYLFKGGDDRNDD